jgi:hypothetical protein
MGGRLKLDAYEMLFEPHERQKRDANNDVVQMFGQNI